MILPPQLAIALLLILPLLAAGGCLVFGKRPNLRDGFAIALGILAAFVALIFFLQTRNADTHEAYVLLRFAQGIEIGFAPEPLGALFALVAGVLWPLATLYGVGYMRGNNEKNQTRFFAYYAIAIHAAMGIALSSNLITLFVFYEILTFSTYPLVAHKGTDESRAAGRLYLGILVSTSIVFLLLAILSTGALAGTFAFAKGGIIGGHIAMEWVWVLLALFAFGIGKAALMPLHRWLPAAMVAPTPVSALLHAVAVVKAGVFAFLKITIFVFGIDYLDASGGNDWLVYVAGFSILAASCIAMQKTNLKARLAYSTISQLAYIVLGAALAVPIAAQGASLHIVMHAVGKITLFFCAGAIYVAHHYTDLKEMDGLAKRMPITYAAMALGALSIIGIPPFGGSWSKFLLMAGAVDADHLLILVVLIVSSLLNLYYLGEIVLRGVFAPLPNPKQASRAEAPLACLIPLCITAILSVLLFFIVELFIIDFV